MFHVWSSGSGRADQVRGILEKFRLPSSCKEVQLGKVFKSKKPTTLMIFGLPSDDRAGRLRMVRLVDWVRTEYLLKRRSVVLVYGERRARDVFEYLLDEEELKLYPPDGWIQRLSCDQFRNATHFRCRSSTVHLRDVLENAATLTRLIS